MLLSFIHTKFTCISLGQMLDWSLRYISLLTDIFFVLVFFEECYKLSFTRSIPTLFLCVFTSNFLQNEICVGTFKALTLSSMLIIQNL